MVQGVTAFVRGVWVVVRAPWLVIVLYVLTLAATVPFAAVLAGQLRHDLAASHPEGEVPSDIDAEWWMEYRRHATGLAATFTPDVIGFAAPLGNLSAVLDATARPAILLAPAATYALLSAWFWGVMLERLRGGAATPFALLAAAGFRRLLPFTTVSLLAALGVVSLYVLVHPLLFGPALAAITPAGGELAARAVVYGTFAACLAIVSTLADLTRVHVTFRSSGIADGVRGAVAFCKANTVTVATVVMVGGVLLVVLLGAYGAVEVVGGARVGGWRAVALAQGYIVARLALRLSVVAAQATLVRRD